MLLRRIASRNNLQFIRLCVTQKVAQSDTLLSKTASIPQAAETPKPPLTHSFSHAGDNGKTTCLSGETLSKDHQIFHAIGATEELLSYLGLTREHAIDAEHDYIHKIMRIQTVLIDISTAISCSNKKPEKVISATYTKELEEWIDEYSSQLPPVELYIIPGGGVASASLHVARSLCRRAERSVIPLVTKGGLDKEVMVYLNRLADFLFTLSRIAAKLDNRTESIYTPKGNEQWQAQ